MTTIPRRGNPVPPVPTTTGQMTLKLGSPKTGLGHRVLLYGPGGIGKTTMAAQAPGPVAFIDLDESLGRLGMDAQVVEGVGSWIQLRQVLQGDGWSSIKTIIIDTITRAEEMALAHTLATVKTEKGGTAEGIEGYGFGKGYVHMFDTFMGLLVDLDKHARAGRNIILIAHDCTTMVPNPAGEDWLRFEPRLQSPNSGKNSIRLRIREWADHCLFIGYDVEAKDKKGKGQGTRTLWPSEMPHCMAKSRSLQIPAPVELDSAELWKQIIK